MIKKILCVTLVSYFAVAAFASDDSVAVQKKIAENCKSYLMSNAVPQNLDEHADAALKACYHNNSCSNDALLDVPDCTKKLLKWKSANSVPKVVNDSTQKNATQKKTTTPAAATQNTTTSAPENSDSDSNASNTGATPVDFNNNDATTPTPSNNNNTSPKKSSINWF